MIALFLQSAAHAAYQVVQATPQVVPVCPPQAPLVLPPLRIAEMPPGMPEWEKILITAGTGAVLGIASSLASERFRRRDAEKELIETISTQLAAELLDNLDKVDQAKAKLAQDMGSPSMSLAAALFFLDNIQNDRFEFYYKTEKTTYYKIDDEKFLYQFYEEIKKALLLSDAPEFGMNVVSILATASSRGGDYVKKHELKYTPGSNLAFYRAIGKSVLLAWLRGLHKDVMDKAKQTGTDPENVSCTNGSRQELGNRN